MRKNVENSQEVKYTCSDCSEGEYDMKFANLDVNGKPTLIKCKFWQHKRIRNEKACANFKPKNNLQLC